MCFATLPCASRCPLLACHLSAFLFVSHSTLSSGVSHAKARGWRGEAPRSAFTGQWAGPATLGPGACESPRPHPALAPQTSVTQRSRPLSGVRPLKLTSDLGTLVTHVIMIVQRDKILHSPWKNKLQRELFPWKFS